MNNNKKNAEFDEAVKNLRETIIAEKDQLVKIGFLTEEFRPGIVMYNSAGNYFENFEMGFEGMFLSLHNMVMNSNIEPIKIDSVKSFEFKESFLNDHHFISGGKSVTIASTQKIHEAALVVANILSKVEKEKNREFGRQANKANVDFYLAKTIGLEEAVKLMRKLEELPTSCASGLYSMDNEDNNAWYSEKELIKSFWHFGKERRADLLYGRTGIRIPESNKDMPLLKKEINRLLEPKPGFRAYKPKPILLGNAMDFETIRQKINS